MNGSPLGIRKTIQLMIILTILAWATQTLLAQWGFGAETKESFMPARRAGGTLELRSEATITGGDVTLKQVCRWSDRDSAVFSPIADLVVLKFSPNTTFQAVGVAELKDVLHEAGVSLASLNFVGAATCTVGRSDSKTQGNKLEQWIAAKQGDTTNAQTPADLPKQDNTGVPAAGLPIDDGEDAPPAPAAASAGPTNDPRAPSTPGETTNEFRSLKQVLIDDLAARLEVPADDLQMHFKVTDEKVLALSEPHFRFQVDASKGRSLGNEHWQVMVISDDSASQKVSVEATARLWQNQVVLAQPVATKQVIQTSDVIDRRTLVDRVDADTLLTREQIVGNQASRDLKPGQVMTGKLIDPVPLARPGQFVTVTVVSGSVKIKTVARAMEAGTFGQTVRVKNEATKDVYEVVLTGPQTGEMSAGGAKRETPKLASTSLE